MLQKFAQFPNEFVLVEDPLDPQNRISSDPVAAALGDTEYVVPRRKTFYGADEIGVREPGGNIVIFAQFGTEGG